MKIVAIVENFDDSYGGPAHSIAGLLNSLASYDGVSCSVVSVRKKVVEVNSNINSNKVVWDNSSRLIGPGKIMYSPELKKRLEAHISEGDVVYINNLWNYVSFTAFKVAKCKGAKVIFSPRGGLYSWSLSQRRLLKKIALTVFQKNHLMRSDAIHVTCQEELEAVRALGVDNYCKIITHGVPALEDFQKYSLLSYERLGLSPKYRYFLFMSRLHKKKGLDVLIDFWKANHAVYPDWKLVIAGPDYGGYKKVIENNLSDSAYYVGEHYGDDKKNLFSIADFFVLPTRSENFGVVIAESLSAKVPVLTTVNAPWAGVNSYGCGQCVEFNDFIEALKSFLGKDASELASMGAKGRRYILQNYTWESKGQDFLNLIKEI